MSEPMGFDELARKIEAGVRAIAASLGVEINGELWGTVSIPGGMVTGCGFSVPVGKGLPPGWQTREQMREQIRSLQAQIEGHIERIAKQSDQLSRKAERVADPSAVSVAVAVAVSPPAFDGSTPMLSTVAGRKDTTPTPAQGSAP